jgi:hypothetical protein
MQSDPQGGINHSGTPGSYTYEVKLLAACAVGLVVAAKRCEGKRPETCAIVGSYRSVSCVEACGGPVIQSSCRACPEGSFDVIECPSSAAGSRGPRQIA